MNVTCTVCNSTNIIKKGLTSTGIQRYSCKDCGKYFQATIDPKDYEDVVKYNNKLAKQKQKLQDINRIKDKSYREYSRVENAISEYVKELRDIMAKNTISFNIDKPTTFDTSDAVGFIHLSDLHFNELVDIVGNSYDFKVAANRLRLLAKKSIKALSNQEVSTVYIIMTGDLLNSDRRLDEVLSMATNRASATFIAIKIMAQFINDIASHFNVKVLSITGNESRIRDEYTQLDSFATDNFDFMIYEGLKLLYESNNIQHIEFISGNTLEYILSVNHTNILITHGHRLGKMTHNDLSKVVTKWSKKGIIINFIMCGHLHETQITDTLLRAGSLVGNNAYADIGLNLHSRASQNIYIIDINGNLDAIKIDLQNIPKNLDEKYIIDEHLIAYNSKSVDKLKGETSILKIVI